MGLTLFHGNFKTSQIDLAHGAFADLAVGIVAVCLLIVGSKVLNGCAATGMLLNPPGNSSGKFAGNQRIFGKIFKITPAADIPVDIQRRSQPKVHTKAFHLISDKVAALLGNARIPALCQGGADWNGCTVLLVNFAFNLPAA